MDKDLVKVVKPVIGEEVLLGNYRKVRGKTKSGDNMDAIRLLCVGKKALVTAVIEGQTDSSGCPLAWVQVDGQQLSWRIASLKRKRKKEYKTRK